MIPARYIPFIFALTTSGIMSFIVCGVATWKALGFGASFLPGWMEAWSLAWPIAFVVLLFVGPMVRKTLSRLTKEGS